MVGPAVKLSETPARVARPSPLYGQHTAEVLGELGYAADEIARAGGRGRGRARAGREVNVAEELLFERDGPLAIVTFNRPQARNAITWAMYDGLLAACERWTRTTSCA